MQSSAASKLLSPASVTLLTERRKFQPYGAAGGEPGESGRNILIHPDGREELLPAKVQLQLAAGDRLRLETPGGGGYGTATK